MNFLRVTTLTATAMILCMSAPSFADGSNPAVKATLSTSYNYSTGDYGQAIDTQITYVPVTAKVKYDHWTAKLTVPYIRISGPGVVVGGEDTTTAGIAGAKGTESGLGDVIASLGYSTPLNAHGLSGDITGKIKFPTADEDKNLGTGNTDYTLQTGLIQTYQDFYFTGTVGRKFNGDSARFQLDDVWKYSLGAGYNFTPATSAGAIYDFREASTSRGKNFSQAIGYVTHKITDKWSTQVYAGSGFTDAAPNLSMGVQISYKFDATGGGSNMSSDD